MDERIRPTLVLPIDLPHVFSRRFADFGFFPEVMFDDWGSWIMLTTSWHEKVDENTNLILVKVPPPGRRGYKTTVQSQSLLDAVSVDHFAVLVQLT